MSRFRWLVAIVCALAVLPAGALAQERGTITGQVVDQATQRPLGGAQIFIVGSNRGTLTNQEGRFLIPNVPAGPQEVRATLIGFTQGSQRVTVAGGETVTVDFTLAQSAIELGGVIVNAIGQQQRTREIGNAVGTINVEQVELAAVNNMTALLQGRSPGVVVTQNTGTTGTASRIRIRGSNSISLSNEPLVIIDGLRIASEDRFTNIPLWQSPSRLNDINPEDIASIEILKGPAAAALYGTAAANGVIQITTKRGRAGTPRWNAYTEQGRITDPHTYPASWRSLSGCLIVDLAEGDCDPADLAPDQLISFNPLEHPDFTPFKDGYRGKYGVSVSGGGEAATYYVSADYEQEDGVYHLQGVNLNWLNRLNLRGNLSTRVSDRLDFTFNTGFTNSNLKLPDNDNSLYGILLNGLLGSADSTVNRGTYGIPFEETFAFETGQEAQRFITGVNANYRPLEWLSLVGTAGLDQLSRHDHDYVGANQVSSVFGALITEGYRRSNRVSVTNFTGTISGTATVPLREGIVSTSSVGSQLNREEYHDTRAFGRGVAPGTRSLQGTSRLFAVSENTVENATLGAFFQQQFGFNDRFFLTGAVRGDQNSAFGTGIGWVWYPSVSASWVVSEEPFFPQIGALSNLRLRSALGRSGLRPSFRDAITYFEPVSVRIGTGDIPGVTVAGTGNPDLRPEITTELELGFDLGLLGERLGLEFTYYNKTADNALVRRVLPPSLGLTTTRWDNIGQVRNQGIEAMLNARPVDIPALRWEVTLTGSGNRNELLELREGIEPIILGSNRNQQRHQPGFPLGGYWSRPVTYEDRNGDGFLQVDEVEIGDTAIYMGQPIPTRELSFNTNLTLFNLLRVSGLVDYKGGHKQMNFTRFDRCSWEILCEAAFNPNNTNLQDQAGLIAFNYLEPGINTAVYLEDSDFVKFRELSFSLMAPERFTNRYGVGGLRLTLSARNLATWSDYSGFDPEVNGFGVFDQGFQTFDYYTQPPLRYYIARIDFNF
ncbi:MAG: SusC/RagA family TonB-linked outer membrane protein [Gemmatimonadetes bacterium]|nr:SusC/RagA family TonB-linked outer membrane protein [Gemmatimonadota bacterium]